MKLYKIYALWAFLFLILMNACTNEADIYSVKSPDNKLAVNLKVDSSGIFYSVEKNEEEILKDSRLGFVFANDDSFYRNFRVIKTDTSSKDETWEQLWGEQRITRNNYSELKVSLKENEGQEREMNIVFRVFNDGIGFRYEFPEQENLKEFQVIDELTEFNFPKEENAWWIPAYDEVFYESLARYTKLSKMDTVTTPLTIELSNGKYVAIHEANLTDYAKMNLFPKQENTLSCDLTPWRETGVKVYIKAPNVTPWRTMIVAEDINELVTSSIMLNLNEPCQIEDVSWIKPGRYIGIWWEIHLGKYTWSSGNKHGATTENTKKYIDFAAENDFSGVLVEGWNIGWDGDWTKNGDILDFTKPYPDFDIEEVSKYAQLKGVELIGHHETAGSTKNYEKQLDKAFAYYQKHGVSSVKTGYVNPFLDNKEFHDGQYGVWHYRKVIETAAKYNIMIDNHEPVMPTGLQRTWPNLMTQEGVRGQEYNAWSMDGGNPPDHTTIMPFLRGLAGPMDFTPGTFNFENPTRENTRVQTTITKELAKMVILYSPLQMASDAPDNYKGHKAFDFVKSVPVNWEKTVVPAAKIGDYAVYARKERKAGKWYVGAITDEESREVELDFNFLEEGKDYIAKIYQDTEETDWKTNPTSYQIKEIPVNQTSTLLLKMAAGGGAAIEISPVVNAQNLK